MATRHAVKKIVDDLSCMASHCFASEYIQPHTPRVLWIAVEQIDKMGHGVVGGGAVGAVDSAPGFGEM